MAPVTIAERVAVLETLMTDVRDDVSEVKGDVKTLLRAGLVADTRRLTWKQIASIHASVLTVGASLAVAAHAVGIF